MSREQSFRFLAPSREKERDDLWRTREKIGLRNALQKQKTAGSSSMPAKTKGKHRTNRRYASVSVGSTCVIPIYVSHVYLSIYVYISLIWKSTTTHPHPSPPTNEPVFNVCLKLGNIQDIGARLSYRDLLIKYSHPSDNALDHF